MNEDDYIEYDEDDIIEYDEDEIIEYEEDENQSPGLLQQTSELVTNVGNVFNSVASSYFVQSMVTNNAALKEVGRQIALMNAAGENQRETIKTKYNVVKDQLSKCDSDIDDLLSELKKFDVNNMDDRQSRMYESILNGILAQRAMSMKMLQEIIE
ncbi:MAG: hypothetical protein MJ169_07235 [Treponema sp.]|nr:hypothetical protein [Treponema sp.]